MTRKSLFLVVLAAIIGLPVCAQAAATSVDDAAVAGEFSYCAALAARGKQLLRNQDGQRIFGGLYTRYQSEALVFSTPAAARNVYQIAIKQRDQEMSGKSIDEQSNYMVARLKVCADTSTAQADRINAYALPQRGANDAAFNPQVGKAEPQDIISVLGKPGSEDYNPDGRFVYLYQTATGSDAYLFDAAMKLVQVRSYCDALKGACPAK